MTETRRTDEPNDHMMARIVLKDQAAFQEFYNLTSPRIFAIIMRILANRALAEEVLQETYLKVWYAADSYHANRGTPFAWLISIARHRAIDVMRGKTMQTQPLAENDPVGLLDIDMGESRLGECMQALEAPQRQSIFAAFFQGLSHSEIARQFSEPIGTIKSRVRRGLSALKGCLES